MFAAHREQTGHTELTALKNYVVLGDKIQTLQIYLNQLSILDKRGTSVLQTPSIEKTQQVPRLLLKERPHRETRLIGRKRPHCNPRLRRRERPRCEINHKLIALQVPPLVNPQVIQPLPLTSVFGGAGKLKFKEQCVTSCRMNSFLTMKKQAEETKLAPISPQVTMRPQMKKAWKLKLKLTTP